jgi:hypothetical protein
MTISRDRAPAEQRTETGATYRYESGEGEATTRLGELLLAGRIPVDELARNSALYLRRQSLARVLMFYELYRLQLDVHGVAAEFGCRYGQNLALMVNLRGILEPYNYTRKVIGFDTFSGFPGVESEDSSPSELRAGDWSVPSGYESHLDEVLRLHEVHSPISHVRKYEIVSGDATKTVREYLEEHDETIFSFVYFDLDLYTPTLEILRAIRPRFVQGTVVAFDELCVSRFPGETRAVMDELGLGNIRLKRLNLDSAPSYFQVT